MDTKRLMIWVAAGSVTAVLGLSAYVVHESKLLTYFSGDPKVCINCHTMNTHYATWQHSSHRERAGCGDCHLPQDSVTGKLLAKARDGFNHSLAMTLGDYGSNLRISSDAAGRIQDNCISCHREIVGQMMSNSEHYATGEEQVALGRPCWSCHRDVPHGTPRNLMTTQNNLGVKEL